MPSKKLLGFWAFVDFCLFTAGVITLVLSIVWRGKDLLRNLVITNNDLTGVFPHLQFISEICSGLLGCLPRFFHSFSLILLAGIVLAIALLVTWAVSVGAIIQPNHVTKPLMILNWLLILDGIGVLVIGTFVWFFSLRQRAEFHDVFAAQSDDVRIQIQDLLKCCGYFNGTDLGVVGGNFCSNATFVQSTNETNGNSCVGPITKYSDYTLNNIFTSVYGYMAVVICLFLATLCVINKVSYI